MKFIQTQEFIEYIDSINLDSYFQTVLFSSKDCSYRNVNLTLRLGMKKNILGELTQNNQMEVNFSDVNFNIIIAHLDNKYKIYLLKLQRELTDMLKEQNIL